MTDKEKIKEREASLIQLVTDFCEQQVNDEYAELCTKLIKKMGRKRNVPFERGKIEIWAAAVVQAIGHVNFLFDKSTEPYASADDICNFFGTSKSTVSQKASQLRKMFKLTHFNNEFATQSWFESNPLNQMVMVDDLIVPISSLPPELQEMVREARAQGEDISFRTK